MACIEGDADLARIVIIGNAGSGKSWLAGELAARLAIPAHDLDPIHWTGAGYGTRRDTEEARHLVAQIAARPSWIVEGVYGWLAAVALPRATALVWLDLPWEACRAGLVARGPRRGMSDADHDALIEWARDYRTRLGSLSHAAHAALFAEFAGARIRLASRAEVAAFAAAPIPAANESLIG